MEASAHWEKVDRMDAIRSKLDRVDDFELWYWMALDAGNQAVNAALHASGVTAEEPFLASQVNDIYAHRLDDGTWTWAVRRGGDIIHPQMAKFDRPVPDRLRSAIEALHTLESFRDSCIRLGEPVTPEVTETCERSYRTCIEVCREVSRDAEASA
jgi:hypothetical protein